LNPIFGYSNTSPQRLVQDLVISVESGSPKSLTTSASSVLLDSYLLISGPFFLVLAQDIFPDIFYGGIEQCFSAAGPRTGTGPWHQLHRAAKGSPGIFHFSFLRIFHE